MLYKSKEDYNEIIKLDNLLNNENIPHEIMDWHDGYRIVVNGKYNGNDATLSIIECFMSHGQERDLLEIYLIDKWEDDIGGLTAEEVMKYVRDLL